MRLKNKTAFISGGGRNSGKAIALTFAREGADVILLARSGDEVRQTARECEELGVSALPITADVSEPEQVNSAVQQALTRFGKVDILVSVVGMRPHRNIWEHTYEEWHRVYAVNLHSIFYLAKAIVPGMIERKSGNIIALGGLASLTAPLPRTALVTSSKHGLYGLIKSLALDLGPYGIRANLIAVGAMGVQRRNPEWYPAGENPHTNPTWRRYTSALGRDGSVDELASVALFLASDQSSYVTGDRIMCAGGREHVVVASSQYAVPLFMPHSKVRPA